MKTLEVSEDLLKRMEALATERGESVNDLVSDALLCFIANSSPKYYSLGGNGEEKRVETAEELAARMKKWDEEEAAFLERMRGPTLDRRSAVEIIREGRDRCG